MLLRVVTVIYSNTGVDVKTLLKCSFETTFTSSQFELSAVQFNATDISDASRKAQQSLPLQLNPGTSASLNIFCTARYKCYYLA